MRGGRGGERRMGRLLPHWKVEELEEYVLNSRAAYEWGMAERDANRRRFKAMMPYLRAVRLCGEVLKAFNNKAEAFKKLRKLNRTLRELGIDREVKLDAAELEDLKEEIKERMRADADYQEAREAWILGRGAREYYDLKCVFQLKEKGDWAPKTFDDILNMPADLEGAVRELLKRKEEARQQYKKREEKEEQKEQKEKKEEE